MTAVGQPVRSRPGVAAQAAPPAGRKRPLREYGLFALMVAPNLLVIAVFAYWPILYNAYLSLTDWNMIAVRPTFVGLANYARTLTDPAFHQTLWVTVVFTGLVVAGSLVIGLALAVLLNQPLAGRGVVRTLSFAPHVLSGAAVATLCLFIFDPGYGLVRALLDPLGLTAPDLNSSDGALFGLVLVYLWKNVGFAGLIYLTGMQGLPRELDEAAVLDGAGAWTRFRRVALPQLRPITFFLLITTVIGTFQAFDVIAVMTGGGPGDATTTLSWAIYSEGFEAFDAGRAATLSIIMFVLLLIVTAVQVKVMERRVHVG
ncbi:carbohydrate ABC transporter permease [Pseudonocardia kunmingensis]|uniref:Carbohydrate ABC transporter membrane protein 1 (CUT1 family) n=1 Tax=Pseudonocardia kunmingensis TaxID=630975 RepID=A0A543DZ72_9PSEU|nr:sugar ABC transporter permease [Pseudonocardia kunmingensis]TQM14635.1 carbohydrate ABC transporter membrane protein 1 (CUT1 family) [Pseudonocardia kunmingensis]